MSNRPRRNPRPSDSDSDRRRRDPHQSIICCLCHVRHQLYDVLARVRHRNDPPGRYQEPTRDLLIATANLMTEASRSFASYVAIVEQPTPEATSAMEEFNLVSVHLMDRIGPDIKSMLGMLPS